MPSEIIFFDDSITRLAEAIISTLGVTSLESGVILRDASGRLSFVASTEAPSEEKAAEANSKLLEVLGAYARTDRPIAFCSDSGAQRILSDTSKLPARIAEVDCWLVDRRIVGSGWLNSPREEPSSPPRIVFASLKGGVGRSTALVVTAADLVSRNKNVLVIDLDLEAPGMGTLLLSKDRIPKFGALDYLVENGIGGVTEMMLDDFVGSSDLATPEMGRLDVVPSIGSSSYEHPENVIPKLARGTIEDILVDGEQISIAKQIDEMIKAFSNRSSYDAILIDSRAGLADLAAPAVLGLGAYVLLFGTPQQQTIEGYAPLFAGLKLLAERDRTNGSSADWRLMFKAVCSKVGLNSTVLDKYKDNLYELFADQLYDTPENGSIDDDTVNFAIDDPSAPHWPLVIPFSQSFVDFDPAQSFELLSESFYDSIFRSFLDGVDELILTDDLAE